MNNVLKNALSLITGSKEKLQKKTVLPIENLELVKEQIKNYTKDTKSERETQKRRKRNKVLCIDGGGIKGIFAVQMMIELEKRLKHPLSSYFNWFAGTSTGSFIATLISLNCKITHIRTLYFVIKNKMFQSALR